MESETLSVAEFASRDARGVLSNLLNEDVLTRQTVIGIAIENLTNRRLLTSASTQLHLTPLELSLEEVVGPELAEMELLIADEDAARKIAKRLQEDARDGDPYRPALIAVIPAGFTISDSAVTNIFDGVLPMPQLPDALAAQLSIALYSHRAFARRYEDQIEELSLHRRIFGSVTNGISVASATEPDMPLQYVNPSFEALTGYTLEEVRGKNCRFLQGEETDQPGLTLVREAVRDGKGTVAILRNYRKDGTSFWNELALSPIRSQNGQISHFIGIQADVTQRIEFEHALRESEKLAVAGRLAAAISHEINNPLESVMNLVFLAQSSESIAEVRGFLELADSELRRVKLITQQSLRFTKQSSKPQAIEATPMIDSILDIQTGRLRAAGVTVVRSDRFSQSFVAFENEVRQVLNNLINNATDAMRKKPGMLYVRSRHATDWKLGRAGIMITIADTGEGMSPETQRDLYKAFYTTKGINGTGLGLWVSTEIVERHRGQLRFRSTQTEGRSGTVFQVFFPYQTIVPDDEGAAETQ